MSDINELAGMGILTADVVPEPNDPIFGDIPLPEWVSEIRPHQWKAVVEAVEAFELGAQVVFIDAPTGSGKTLIGEMVRRVLEVKALYVCHSKSLQDQFLADFPYAKVMKGRSNYPTLNGGEGTDCGMCTKLVSGSFNCLYCDKPNMCPYQVAKRAARMADIAVLNTAFLLAATNYANEFQTSELVIIDECDVMEGELMGFVEFAVSARTLSTLGLEAPKSGVHSKTVRRWIADDLRAAIDNWLQVHGNPPEHDDSAIKQVQAMTRLWVSVNRVLADWTNEDEWEGWVRDNKAGPMVLKPVKVEQYGQGTLWKYGKRWLCMSASIISAEQLAEDLGIEAAGMEWVSIQVPMTFAVEHREIRVVSVASMVAKTKEQAWPAMATALGNIARLHEGERILVHTVSYELSDYLCNHVSPGGRPIISYDSGSGRDQAVADFRGSDAGILIAPSLDRGVDFKGDDCRVVAVAKVPFPYLGDAQVSSRLHGPGGEMWYAVQTIRKIVQMTGRGVRSEDDWCVNYILDMQFMSNVWKRNKRLFPEWWREAVDLSFPRSKVVG